jgi:hypothetical protein
MCLFVTLLVISSRSPWPCSSTLRRRSDVPKIKSLAMAMLAAFIGACVDNFFLRGPIITCSDPPRSRARLRRQGDPRFDVKLTRRDIAIAVALCVFILGALVQTKRKGVVILSPQPRTITSGVLKITRARSEEGLQARARRHRRRSSGS